MKTLQRLLTWLSEILRLLRSIDARLAELQATSDKLDRCMDNRNHRAQMCLKTGHWNDSPSR